MKQRRSCIVDTTYTLSLYLLLSSMEEIKNTYFFVGGAIPKCFSKKLGRIYWFPSKVEYFNSKWDILCTRIKCILKYRLRIMFSDIYAQDHLPFSSMLLGECKYTLLEDAPGVFTYATNSRMFQHVKMGLHDIIHAFIYFGPHWGEKFGMSPRCVNRIFTDENDLKSSLISGKPHLLMSLKELWESSSTAKQQFIKSLFDISSEMLELGRTAETVIFTQPLMEDFGLSNVEMFNLYNEYIDKYKGDGIVIKVHPRDGFNYEKFFPDVIILKNKAPMQLLNIMGLTFKRAVTCFSTAVSNMPKGTEVIVFGTAKNNKLIQGCDLIEYSSKIL